MGSEQRSDEMRILVAAGFPANSKYANAINTIKIADGFAKNGHDVVVVCRRPRSGAVEVDILRERFGLSDAVCFEQVPATYLGVPLDKSYAFAHQVSRICGKMRVDLAYCRNFVAPVQLANAGIPTVAESHAPVGHKPRVLCRMLDALRRHSEFRALVTIAPVLRNHFVSLGAPEEKVHVLPDGVDLEHFIRPPHSGPCRFARPKAVYAGHLYDYKGVPTILEAACLMPDIDFVLVGGHADDVKRVSAQIRRKNISNVELTGWLPHSSVPQWLWDADVLLLPPSVHHPSARWTSPVKLGEYLASGTPIVASRIPALEYWLRNGEVCFVDPDNAVALSEGIRAVLDSKLDLDSMTDKALQLAMQVSYTERSRKMLEIAGVDSPGQRT